MPGTALDRLVRADPGRSGCRRWSRRRWRPTSGATP